MERYRGTISQAENMRLKNKPDVYMYRGAPLTLLRPFIIKMSIQTSLIFTGHLHPPKTSPKEDCI